MGDVWPMVHAERAALVHDLEGLHDRQWEEPSLCEGWTVHDVVAHLTDTARTTRLGFLAGLARAGFDFDRQNARGVARERGASCGGDAGAAPPGRDPYVDPAGCPSTADWSRRSCTARTSMRPLGLARPYPAEAVVRSLRLQARTPASFGGAKELVSRVRLTAAAWRGLDRGRPGGERAGALAAPHRLPPTGGAGRPRRAGGRRAGCGALTVRPPRGRAPVR